MVFSKYRDFIQYLSYKTIFYNFLQIVIVEKAQNTFFNKS
jgi:hypothetical protein